MKTLVSGILLVASIVVASSAFAAGDDSLWKRVQRMDPGTRITVTVDGAPPSERYFVRLTDSELVVLNLTGAELPKRQLIGMAKDNPEWMAGTSKTTYKDNGVRVGPDGVFVKDKKVAELSTVVEHLAREKVTALR